MQEGIFFIQNAFTLRSQLQLGEQSTEHQLFQLYGIDCNWSRIGCNGTHS